MFNRKITNFIVNDTKKVSRNYQKPRVAPRVVVKDELNKYGQLERKYEFKSYDYSKPMTAQSGIETKTGDLDFMMRTNVRIETYNPMDFASVQTNPFDSYSKIVDIASRAENSLNALRESENVQNVETPKI